MTTFTENREPANDEDGGKGEPPISAPHVAGKLRVIAVFVILVVVVGVVGGGLYAFFGTYWWAVALVLIVVPLLFWQIARLRDRVIRQFSSTLGFTFRQAFPAIPEGLPAHGRTPSGFTEYTLTRAEGRLMLNVYEHTYRIGRSGNSRAHGLWWEYPELLYPRFEVTVRHRVFDFMGAWLHLFSGGAREEISFAEDPQFSARFIVHGPSEPQVRRFFTSNVRKVLVEQMDTGRIAGSRKLLGWDRTGRLWGRRSLEKLLGRGERIRVAFETAARLA